MCENFPVVAFLPIDCTIPNTNKKELCKDQLYLLVVQQSNLVNAQWIWQLKNQANYHIHDGELQQSEYSDYMSVKKTLQMN